jgi:hypothetical protein
MYELIALKELAAGGLLGKSIIPVVEPIKITSTFDGLLNAFAKARLELAVIYNPEVGDLSGEPNTFDALYSKLSPCENIIPSILVNDYADAVIEALESKSVHKNTILTMLNSRDFVDNYAELFETNCPRYTLAPDERQIRRNIKSGKVLFEDKFNKQEKNADYLKNEDEFYSDDHLFYIEEGFEGFGDYSVIGNEFNESGFAPRAVAIHIVYFDKENALRVCHFVSDSNMDITDVAGKFHEAVMKLQNWYNNGQQRQLTSSLKTLLNHAKDGTYPGLPTIKKLTIMHHLELIGKFLDRGVS